ncbi:MAG: hypothetical protein IKY70_03625, partial [Bacteroidales bacterium]|nr:hypothetical protein [Bacteroidales bacterium]
ITGSGQLKNASYYDYSAMVFVPEYSEDMDLSELKVKSNITLADDNSDPLISNATVNGQQLVSKQKQVADDSRKINKARLVK